MALNFGNNLFGGSNELFKRKTQKIIQLRPGAWVIDQDDPALREVEAESGWGVYQFDDAIYEAIATTFILPDDYDGGEVFINIYWTSITAIVGNVYWRWFYRSREIGQTKSGGSVGGGMVPSAPGTLRYIKSDRKEISSDIPMKPGNIISFHLARWGDNANDTMIGDAELLFVTIEYTGY